MAVPLIVPWQRQVRNLLELYTGVARELVDQRRTNLATADIRANQNLGQQHQIQRILD